MKHDSDAHQFFWKIFKPKKENFANNKRHALGKNPLKWLKIYLIGKIQYKIFYTITFSTVSKFGTLL